jgi:TPR repeat protein
MSRLGTPQRRKDGTYDERYSGARELNQQIENRKAAERAAAEEARRRAEELRRRREATTGTNGRALHVVEQRAKESAGNNALAGMTLTERACHGDPAALELIAAHFLHGGQVDASSALEVYACACSAGLPGALSLPSDGERWNFVLERGKQGQAAAMYSVAAGLGEHDPDSGNWLQAAAQAGLPAARLKLALRDPSSNIDEIVSIGLSGNVRALDLLAEAGDATSGTGSGHGAPAAVPSEIGYMCQLVRLGWILDALGVPANSDDPLRLAFTYSDAIARTGTSGNARHALSCELTRRDRLREQISEPMRAEAVRRASAYRSLSRSGLTPVMNTAGTLVLSWFTAGIYGVVWFGKWLGKASGALGAIRSSEAGMSLMQETPKKLWSGAAIGWVLAGCYVSFAFMLNYLDRDGGSPGAPRRGDLEVAVMMGIGLLVGATLGVSILRYMVRVRDRILNGAGCSTRVWTVRTHLTIWLIGWCTAWLLLGIPILLVHAIITIRQLAAVTRETAKLRPHWFSWEIGKIPQRLKPRFAAELGDASA